MPRSEVQWMRFALVIALLCLSFVPASAQTAAPVLTRSYNNQRLGNNTQETTLTPANVNAGSFGRLFSRQVDGEIYAQPLYVPNLTINGKTQNVVIVATMHDSLYAFDADDPNAAAPLWQTTYLNPAAGITTVPTSDVGFACGTYNDIAAEVGILSTPVIDPNTGTLYLVARTKEANSANRYVQRIHAVDIITGLDRIAPMAIAASFPTRAGGSVVFDPLVQNQRAALLLDHGVLYIAWASHCDSGNYHGWVMAYDPFTFAQRGVFCSTPDGSQGGIWQSGQGPAADAAGNIYVAVGNGDSSVKNKPTAGTGYSNALVKLKLSGNSLTVTDWFMPYNTDSLNNSDLDSACGPVLFPGANGKTYAFMGGKDGVCYVTDSASLGKYNPNNPGSPQNDYQILESFQAANRHLHGSAGYFAGDTGTWMYLWGEYSSLHAYAYNGTQFASTPSSQSTFNAPDGMPGAAITVSSNGGANGIVWTNLPYQGDANQAVVPGVLRAFDATDVSKELWNSRQSPARDDFGNFAKYCPPVVTNGKVYMATFSNTLAVYGVLPAPLAPTGLTAAGLNQAVGLSWNAAPYAASYTVLRGASATGPYNPIATGVTTTGYLNTGLTNGTTYYYRVFGVNGLGSSDPSNIAYATPNAVSIGAGDGLTATYYTGAATNFSPEATAPLFITVDPTVNFANGYTNDPAPSPFDAGVPATQFTGVWTGKLLAPYTAAYTFQTVSDDGVKVTVNGSLIISNPAPHSGVYDTAAPVTLVGGQYYDVKIEYYNATYGAIIQFLWSAFGQPFAIVPQSQLYSYPATVPAQVLNLSAAAGNGYVQLSWAGAAGAASFNVKRGLSASGPFTTIATGLTARTYKDSGVTNNVTYYYVVSAVNAYGEGPDSNPALAQPSAGGVSIGIKFLGTDTLPMAASELAGFIPITGWNNATGTGGALTALADSKGVRSAAQITYSAYGVYAAGIGDATPNSHLLNGYLDTHDTTTTTVTVSGLPATYAAYGYDVYVYTLGSDPARAGVYTIGTTAKTSAPTTWGGIFKAADNYLFFPNVNNSGFQLTATPAANNGYRAPINAVQIVPHNAPPTTLTATSLNAQILLKWTASADAGTYTISRSLSGSAGTFTPIVTGVAATTYTDTGLTNGTRYYYVVQTVNGNGSSANSNIANAVPVAPVIGTGNGLLGTYYAGDAANFSPETTPPIIITTDATVNFAQDEGAAYNPSLFDLLVPHDHFTAVWTGQILAPYTGSYKFQTITDDGARLTVNGVQIINQPNYQAATAYTSATVTLTAGVKYSIKMEYFQGVGGLVCQLLYSPNGQAFQIIPQSQLYAATTSGAPGKTLSLNAYSFNSSVKLVWGGAANAATYTIKRSSVSGGPYTTIATGVTGRTYLDIGLTNYARYYYVVNAVNASGSGAASNQAIGTPYQAFQYVWYTFEDGPQGKNPDVITDVTGFGNTGAMIGGDAGFTTDSEEGAYAAIVKPGVHAALPANFDFYDQFRPVRLRQNAGCAQHSDHSFQRTDGRGREWRLCAVREQRKYAGSRAHAGNFRQRVSHSGSVGSGRVPARRRQIPFGGGGD